MPQLKKDGKKLKKEEDLEIYKYIRKKIGKDPKPSQY